MTELLIRLVALAAALAAVAIVITTVAALWPTRRSRPVLAVDDPSEDLMGVARTADVQPEATHCEHCKKPPRDHLTYCARSRTIEAFHYCCPSGCELGPAEPEPAPPVADVPPAAPPKMAASTPAAAAPQRDPHPGRPYAMGGWADVGGVRVHRACSDARRDGRRICTYCQPILVGPASELPR